MNNDRSLPLIPFDDMGDLLLPLGCINSPAELHGMLCGKLCGGATVSEADWPQQALEFLDLAGGAGYEVSEALIQLLLTTRYQLQDEGYGLELLLPGDYVDLDQRIASLSQWCHGFLSGFGSSGLSGNQEFSPTSAEAVRDLAAIVQATADDETRDEDDAERDYFNLVEYVRMAVLSLYADFGQPAEEDFPGPVQDDDIGLNFH